MKDIVATASIILAYILSICIVANYSIGFMLHAKMDASFLNLTKVNILKIMNKKEFKIGETFQCGLVILKCVKSDNFYCDGCFLEIFFTK